MLNKMMVLAGTVSSLLIRIEGWLFNTDGIRVPLHKIKGVDQCRLLKFRTWSLRYYVEVEEILEMVLPVLRNQMRSRVGKGLGVPIKILTGRKAEEILRDQIKRRYPDGENKKVWASRERERQIQRELRDELSGMRERDVLRGKTRLEVGILEWTHEYQKQISARHKRWEKIRARNLRSKRRGYRRNPWVI